MDNKCRRVTRGYNTRWSVGDGLGAGAAALAPLVTGECTRRHHPLDFLGFASARPITRVEKTAPSAPVREGSSVRAQDYPSWTAAIEQNPRDHRSDACCAAQARSVLS